MLIHLHPMQLVTLQRVACELQIVPHQSEKEKKQSFRKIVEQVIDKSKEVVEKRCLLLRGQMQYIEDWNGIMFLCNPL